MADATHAAHDPLALAAATDGDGVLGVAWARACGACATLLGDLLSIRRAIPDAALPSRPRDYRLSTADAAALRRGRLRTWFAALGTARDAVSRPVATSLVGLGLAGLLLGIVPTAMPAGAGAVGGGSPGAGAMNTLQTPGRESIGEPSGVRPVDTALPRDARGGPEATPSPERPMRIVPGPVTPLATLSAILLAAGAILLALRRVAGNHRRREVV